MNTITHNNYGCIALHAHECKNLFGGFWSVVWQVIKYGLYIIDAIDAIPEFVEGFKEGWIAAGQQLK